jgi:hypothetical protein
MASELHSTYWKLGLLEFSVSMFRNVYVYVEMLTHIVASELHSIGNQSAQVSGAAAAKIGRSGVRQCNDRINQ